jgi:hypothetical protein
VVVGAARSGTTLVGNLIARHSDVAYWVEPKYIWEYGARAAEDDVRTAVEATPGVRRYIRRRFARFAADVGRPRFAEKTPSNCFRIPFVDAVLPEAHYVHVVRDGRDAVFSALGKWTSPPASDAVVRRLTSFEVPLRDLPRHAARVLARVVRNPWTHPEWELWGPRYPGIRSDRRRLPLLEVCAHQWVHSVATLRRGLASIPDERIVMVRYEELTRDPTSVMDAVLHRLELSSDDDILQFAAGYARDDRAHAWRSRSPDELDAITPIIKSELEALGYA